MTGEYFELVSRACEWIEFVALRLTVLIGGLHVLWKVLQETFRKKM